MMNKRYFVHHFLRSVLIVSLALFVALTTIAVPAEAESDMSVKKMTVYDKVLRIGNFAFCAVSDDAIYKVNLKTNKVRKLVAVSEVPHSMRKNGSYLYYVESTMGGNTLYRVSVKTGKRNRLGPYYEYVISGNRIYCDGRVMKLDGSCKKKSTTSIKMKSIKNSNKKYRLVMKYTPKDNGEQFKAWLKTPNGKIYLGKGFVMYG